MVIVLDTFPVSSTGKHTTEPPTLLDQCYRWIDDCERAGHRILVPAIAYYEVLRELERKQAFSQIARLRTFCLQPQRFIPLTTSHLELAAKLWGEARRNGKPTADVLALDCDVILAAQTLSLHVNDVIVATTNPTHILRFIPAANWMNTQP